MSRLYPSTLCTLFTATLLCASMTAMAEPDAMLPPAATSESGQMATASSAPALPVQVTSQPVDVASIKTPKIQEFRTRSGTRVLFAENHQLPIVDLKLVFNAGSARDQILGKPYYGLSSLVASMLDEGTATHSADQIAETFEQLGARYSAAAYRDMFSVDLRSQSDPKILQPAVNQLAEILSGASFPQSGLERIRQNLYTGQKQRNESPGGIAGIRFWRELYGSHPYAEPTTGTPESIRNITTEDLTAFRNRLLVAQNASIAITGDLSLPAARKLAEELTRKMPQGQPADPLPVPEASATGRVVDVPFNSTQAHVMLGMLGIDRANPDLASLLVGNELLGGGDFNARLMEELREKRGLTYGAYSQISPMAARGPFVISFATRSDQAGEAVDIARQTLQQFLASPVAADRLEKARQGIIKRYASQYSSNQLLNDQLGMMGFYGYPATYLADYLQQLNQVTPQSIYNAFKPFASQPLLILKVGATAAGKTP